MGDAWLFGLVGTMLWAAGKWSIPSFIRFLEAHRMTVTNFQGKSVPTCGGLLIWGLLAAAHLVWKMVDPAEQSVFGAEWLTACSVVCLIGLIDDLQGDRKMKGIIGHWRSFLHTRTLTTGLLKAGAAAFPAWGLLLTDPLVGLNKPVWLLSMQLLIMPLAANAVNLLDVRPGRAIKFFLAAFSLLAAIHIGWMADAGAGLLRTPIGYAALPIVIGALLLAGPDLKGRIMLGDTGANVLGFTLGLGIIGLTPPAAQVICCMLLAALHLYTLRHSLSQLIERKPFLRWLDEAGRRKHM